MNRRNALRLIALSPFVVQAKVNSFGLDFLESRASGFVERESSTKNTLEDLEGALRWISNPANEKYGFSEHEKAAFYYQNLKNGEKLSVDASEQMQVASLLKVPIAILYQESIRSGIIVNGKKFNPEFNQLEKKCFEEMLVNSDNVATNYLMEQLGGPENVQRQLEKLVPGIFEGKLKIKNYIPLTKDEFPEARAKGLPTNVQGLELDTEFYYTNTCSPEAMGEVFVKLYNKEFKGSDLILKHLGQKKSNMNRMRPDIISDDVKIIGKTGTTGRNYSVFGIVAGEVPYVFGGVIDRDERLPGGLKEWKQNCELYDAMRAASGNTYRYANNI